MKKFEHLSATSIAQASSALASENAWVISGGTDLLGWMKDGILGDETYPNLVIDLKTIPDTEYIREEDGVLKIGAGTKLVDIIADETVKTKYPVLAQAAAKVSSPTVRHMGSIGGSINQLHRCWYFRAANDRFHCFRKGGATCFAMLGDNRYHSIMGPDSGCIAVHPSDIAPALVVLNATIVTNTRTLPAEDFWQVNGPKSTALDQDELVTEIQIPALPEGSKSAYMKFAQRRTIDFPIVGCAVAITSEGTRICLSGVYPIPYRATEAEDVLAGGRIDASSAAAAGEAAVINARPFPKNTYKVQIAKTLVARTLLAAAAS